MKYLISILLLLQSAVVFAVALEPVVAVSQPTARTGETTVFTLYLHNSTEKAVRFKPQKSIVCRLKSSGKTIELKADALDPVTEHALIVQQQGFVKVSYALTLPASVSGTVALSIPEFGGVSAMFTADGAIKSPTTPESPSPVTTGPLKYESLDSLFTLYQPYIKNISAYQPMYFAVGTEPEKSKFQVSFKYRLFNPDGFLAMKYPGLKGLHFAYTQTSFWDLKSSSLPFEDTSYKPELFLITSNMARNMPELEGFFVQTGFQHESNGRGGENSRSTNFLYAKPIFIFYSEENRIGLQISPKIWAYVANEEETNPDLHDYRGYFDLELKAGKAEGLVIGSNLGWAEKGGSFQLDLTYPLRKILFGNIDLYLQLQYVSRLAESLINYKERTEALRFGFAIVR